MEEEFSETDQQLCWTHKICNVLDKLPNSLQAKAKGCGSRMATLTMVFKLLESAQKRWQRIHGYVKVEDIWQGIKYQDGIRVEEILDGKIKLTEVSELASV